jgi:hypothetical protein
MTCSGRHFLQSKMLKPEPKIISEILSGLFEKIWQKLGLKILL